MFSAVRHLARPRPVLRHPAARVPVPRRTIVSASPSLLPSVAPTVAAAKKYTPDHEFVEFDDATGVGTVGITNHAQETLGDVVFVDLPKVGSKISQGDAVGAVESVKAASDIFAPVSGEVVQVNEALNDEPGLVNRSSDEKGWLCKIKLSDPAEVDKLLTLEAYTEICEPE